MSTKKGEFSGEAVQYEGPNGSFLAWKIAMVRVGSKTFPITAATGVKGTSPAAVYNLGHGSFRSAVAYVFRNIVRAVMVDNSRQGVEYTLDVAMHGFGLDKGITMALNQKSRNHTLGNKRAAARTFAELIVNSAISGYYIFLRNAGWEAASKTKSPENLVADTPDENSDTVQF